MKVFIANFPFDLTETDICELFKIFGEIIACKLVTDTETRQSRGFGFVEFRDKKQARLAMKTMNGLQIGGRYVAVTPSTNVRDKALQVKHPRLKNMGRII